MEELQNIFLSKKNYKTSSLFRKPSKDLLFLENLKNVKMFLSSLNRRPITDFLCVEYLINRCPSKVLILMEDLQKIFLNRKPIEDLTSPQMTFKRSSTLRKP